MNLTIDANILVSELARDGNVLHSLLTHPVLETLYIAEYTWNEAIQVIDNRLISWVRSGRFIKDAADHLETVAKIFAAFRCTVVAEQAYAAYEAEARTRIPGDPDDWHSVALAMATKTAIWTLDQKHFFGCGMAIWNTKILRAVLMDRES